MLDMQTISLDTSVVSKASFQKEKAAAIASELEFQNTIVTGNHIKPAHIAQTSNSYNLRACSNHDTIVISIMLQSIHRKSVSGHTVSTTTTTTKQQQQSFASPIRAQLAFVLEENQQLKEQLAKLHEELQTERQHHSDTKAKLDKWQSARIPIVSIEYTGADFAALPWTFVMADLQSLPGSSTTLMDLVQLIAHHNPYVLPIQAVIDAVAMWQYIDPFL
jgi:hypothetical protein